MHNNMHYHIICEYYIIIIIILYMYTLLPQKMLGYSTHYSWLRQYYYNEGMISPANLIVTPSVIPSTAAVISRRTLSTCLLLANVLKNL